MQQDYIKVINATYKLLEFFPENEPLKNKAKEKALAILEHLAVRDNDKQIVDDIAVLEKFLELGKMQGWIDGMNFLIVQKEIRLIEAGLQKQIPNHKPQITKEEKSAAPEIFRKEPRHIESVATDYSPRQRKIMELLKKQEKIQVRDIIKEMPDVTKRTLRRDLDDLLKKGAIERVGEFNQIFYRILGDKPGGTFMVS